MSFDLREPNFRVFSRGNIESYDLRQCATARVRTIMFVAEQIVGGKVTSAAVKCAKS